VWGSTALLVLSGVFLFIGLLSAWANTTVFDSTTFSERAVDVLNEPPVRRELAKQLTEQLVLGGNQQAVAFRPAFQLAIEAAIDTDTFKSIFRTAVRRTHEAILSGQQGGSGLNLSDSISIIASTLQLPNDLKPQETEGSSLGNSLENITKRASELWVFKAKDLTAGLAAGGVAAAALAAAGGIALSRDRRRAVLRLGIVVVVAGLLLTGVVPLAGWFAARGAGDPQLSHAIRGAIGRAMADLSTIGMWVAAYGVVTAAAAATMGGRRHRLTPRVVSGAVGRWVERRRMTTRGTVLIAVLALLGAMLLSQDPQFWLRAALLIAALWLAYFGVTELLGLVQRVVVDTATLPEPQRRSRRALAIASLVAVLAVAITGGLALTAGGAARRAEAAGKPLCNGDASLCDLPLNRVLFAGTHNSMSSALYPGWLFAEHALTVEGQLEKGVRALLLDTHYGIPSASKLPGSETQLILTDRAAELHDPRQERADPVASQRADQLAARAPKSGAARRGIYLCHARCELGATRFGDTLTNIKLFVDSHPDEVVLIDLEDHTDPVETANAIAASGLADRAYTLQKDQPLPTLGDMIRARKNVVIVAEVGGSGTPPWYHKAYDWLFQETPYSFDSADQFNCAPNRGPTDAPLLLVNHWLSNHDPAAYTKVNSRAELTNRIRQCIRERGRIPTVIAVDFSAKGDVVGTVKEANRQLLSDYRRLRGITPPAPTGPTTTTAEPPPGTPAPTSVLPPLDVATPITSLTGGDPAAFCQAVPAADRGVTAWALASLVAAPGGRALPDFAYGPVVAADLGNAYAVGPEELVRQGALAIARARAAVAALRNLGLDQAAMDELASKARTELTSAENRDPAVVQQIVLDDLRGRVGADQVSAAAVAFANANPEPPGLFDLGDISPEVAQRDGYGACPTEPAPTQSR
jgi:hypothetical protein